MRPSRLTNVSFAVTSPWLQRVARPNPVCRHLRKAAPVCASLPSPIAFIGAGNMATAIIARLRDLGPGQIRASAPRQESLDKLQLPPTNCSTVNADVAQSSALVFLCVKPYVALSVLDEIAPVMKPGATLVSIVAGLTTADISNRIDDVVGPGHGINVLRVMPNLPCTVGQGASGICAADSVSDATVESVESVMRTVGIVERVPENLFAALTSMCTSGLAAALMMAEALADAGVRHGLKRDVACRLAAQTVAGAGALARGVPDVHTAELRNMVESPGGVTIAGTAALERGGFRASILSAVDACVERGLEMGEKN